MSYQLECPYCNEEFYEELEGCQYEDNCLSETECPKCEKMFVFRTNVSISLDAYKADCLNGEKHDYRPTNWYLVHEHQVGLYKCYDCENTKKMTKEEALKLGLKWKDEWDKFLDSQK